MPERTAGPAPAIAVPKAPPGHSAAAHRVHGWCFTCKDRTPGDEALAWRGWAAERQALREASAEAGQGQPHITAGADPARRCPECGELLLTVVTVRVLTDSGPRVAGGWAYCSGCDATPHPVMAVSER